MGEGRQKLSVRFRLRRSNGVEVVATPSEMSIEVAALGVDGVQHELQIDGEKVVVGFEFDPPLIPKPQKEKR